MQTKKIGRPGHATSARVSLHCLSKLGRRISSQRVQAHEKVGFTSIYPAVNNFFPRSSPRRLRSRAIQSNRSESARFRLLMRTHVASCAREMRKDIGGGIALEMRKELLPRERKRERYYIILYEIMYWDFFKNGMRFYSISWPDESEKKKMTLLYTMRIYVYF